MLQFNGMPSNADVGTVQGFDSLTGSPPFDRTELYQLWFGQALFDNKLILRIGKTAPTASKANLSFCLFLNSDTQGNFLKLTVAHNLLREYQSVKLD